MLQYFPVSPREKFRLHNGQLVLLGAKQTRGRVCLRGGSGLLRSLRLQSGKVSRWLLILQDEAPGPWWWESAPPLCGLAPLGGGGGSVSGPAWWGSAVGWAGWSQEAGVQGWSDWRARQVLWQRHVRQPCFCNVVGVLYYNFLKERGEKATTVLQVCYVLQRQQPQNTPWLDRGHVTKNVFPQTDKLQRRMSTKTCFSLKCCRN